MIGHMTATAEISAARRMAQRDATTAELPSVTPTEGVVGVAVVVGVATWRENKDRDGGGVGAVIHTIHTSICVVIPSYIHPCPD